MWGVTGEWVLARQPEGVEATVNTTPIRRVAAAVALVVALVAVPMAVAGKGGKPGHGGAGGTTSGYVVAVDQAAPYVFGQSITVTTNVPPYPNNTGPWIDLRCYQNGAKVLGVTHAGFAGGWYYGWPFSLGPTQMWTGGAADCTVVVSHQSNKKIVTDASTSFHVDG